MRVREQVGCDESLYWECGIDEPITPPHAKKKKDVIFFLFTHVIYLGHVYIFLLLDDQVIFKHKNCIVINKSISQKLYTINVQSLFI